MTNVGRPIGSGLTMVEYEARYKTILDLYDAGVTQNEIAMRLTLTRQRIQQILRHAGRISNKRITLLDKIRKLVDQGIAYEDACDRLKVSRQTRINYRIEFGITPPPRLIKPSWLTIVCTLIEAKGKSAAQIASELGCHRTWVHSTIQKIREQGFGHLLNLVDGRSEND